MAFTARFTADARNDLRGIHTYIAENDSQRAPTTLHGVS